MSPVKRDNMGYAIHPLLIVLLIMLAAALVVCMGFAVNRLFVGEESDGLRPRSVEQEQYMVDVRQRNLAILAQEGRRSQLGRKPYMDAR